MTWDRKVVEDDGQIAEIEQLGPFRWRLRNLSPVIAPEDHYPEGGEFRTRRQAISAASEWWAVHPDRWEEG